MALRLIERVVPEQDGAEVFNLLKDHKVLEHRQIRLSDEEVLVRILLDAEQSESVLDRLGERYAGQEGNRVVILACVSDIAARRVRTYRAARTSQSEGKVTGADQPGGIIRGHQKCRVVYAGLSGNGDGALARAEHGLVARHDAG
ncbi:hypothetical protein A1359_09240 [Methylomonas lenta]|uniref:Uncharacterized protein n=1 Tax=Methylomonas lenta TaxID=980561 RepID=A0A177NEV6_9GAMM|nr:hypothetical protein [Methylomonas lenta]OAI15590.1 hypothetical protein A1359_09240 [Methylomonas lenta]